MKDFFKKAKTKNWHQNFVNADTLPDISLIKFDVLVRSLVGLFFLISLGMLSVSEINNFRINYKINEFKDKIANNRESNSDILKLNESFSKEAGFAKTLQSFYDSTIDPIELIANISKTRPAGLLFDGIRCTETMTMKEAKQGKFIRNYEIILQGFIKGDDDSALDAINNYETQLNAIQLVPNAIKQDVQITALRREPTTGLFVFVITIELQI